MNLNSIFGKYQILPGTSKQIGLSCINLIATREKEGWYLNTIDNCNQANTIVSEESVEKDFFQTGKSNSLIIAPAFPAKPLVFKGTKLNVLPNQKLTFFLKIPLSFQVYYSKNLPENLLKEITYKKLSDTWFGEPDNGEPAFALGSEYFFDINEIETSDFEAICPVTVQNNSANILNVQRLIIRNDNITLYKNENKIVTSVVQIEYKGDDIISSANYRYSKLFNGEKQEILAKPKNTSGKNMLRINFHFIKNIYKSE